MADGIRVEIPDNVAQEAEKYLNLSGYASVSDAARSLLRDWAKNRENDSNPTKSERLSKNTCHNLFPMWMKNFRRNIDDVEKSRDLVQLEEKYRDRKTAVVIGAGPSVHKYGHIKMLKKSGYDGVIIATDRILIPCLKEGLIPNIVISLDGDFEVSEFFKHELVKKHGQEMDVVFSSVVDNATVKTLPRRSNVYFFNPHMDTMDPDMSVSKAMWWMTNRTVMHTGGNVGAACWFLSVYMNKSPIGLIGMDLSYPDIKDIQEIPTFGIYDRMHQGDPEKIIKCFRRDYHPFFKTEAIVDYIMDTYYEVFKTWIGAIHSAHGVDTINCTGGGAIHPSDGLECLYFDDFLKKYKK